MNCCTYFITGQCNTQRKTLTTPSTYTNSQAPMIGWCWLVLLWLGESHPAYHSSHPECMANFTLDSWPQMTEELSGFETCILLNRVNNIPKNTKDSVTSVSVGDRIYKLIFMYLHTYDKITFMNHTQCNINNSN